MHLIRGLKAAGKESGQLLILFALLLPLLCLFVGFAIDFGFAFLVRSQIAKACDSATLTAIRNYGQGTSQATTLGSDAFNLNVNPTSSLYVSAPAASLQFTTDASSDPVCTCTGSAKIHTFFLGLGSLMGIKGHNTLTVAAVSQATRPPVLLSLVLDKSGSMACCTGGAGALPGAVSNFINYFKEGFDQAGEVSFSSIATNPPDVVMSSTFKTAITNSVNSMSFGGYTFAADGMTEGLSQITGVSNPPTNAQKVVVFFTDGWANTAQEKLPYPGGTLENFGGCAPMEFNLGWCGALHCMNSTTGNENVNSPTNVATTDTAFTCNGVTKFTPKDTADLGSSPVLLTINNIAKEADYDTVQVAESMRSQGITVYSIGLGSVINQTYLQEVANDPASPQYNSSEPTGAAVFAPTADDLQSAFSQIASKILLRLTQ